jgi:DNA polymerase-1
MLRLETDTLTEYNWVDCLATSRSKPALDREAIERDMMAYWHRAVWPLVAMPDGSPGPVMDMQRRGMRVDVPALRGYRGQLGSDLSELEAGIVKCDPTGAIGLPTDKAQNGLSAPTRLRTFLYDTLGLVPQRRTEVAKLAATDQEALLAQLATLRKKDEHVRPVLYDLLHRSRLHTIYTRYLEMPLSEDGRVRPRVKLGGTRTGRFAYADPPLQQIPKEARHVFVPNDGHVFLAVDYSQLEARIAAQVTGDLATLELFAAGGDIHRANAQSLFGWSSDHWDTLTPDARKAARNFAKTFYYGAILYGGEAETVKMKTYCPCPRCEAKLPQVLEVSRPTVTAASQRYFATHPCYMRYRDEVGKSVSESQCLTNPLGRKRYFCEPWPRCKRAAWNWPIQSTAADIINRAMIELHRRYRAPIALQLHDALYFEIPDTEIDLWTARATEVMAAPIPEFGGASFPVDVEVEAPWGVGKTT